MRNGARKQRQFSHPSRNAARNLERRKLGGRWTSENISEKRRNISSLSMNIKPASDQFSTSISPTILLLECVVVRNFIKSAFCIVYTPTSVTHFCTNGVLFPMNNHLPANTYLSDERTKKSKLWAFFSTVNCMWQMALQIKAQFNLRNAFQLRGDAVIWSKPKWSGKLLLVANLDREVTAHFIPNFAFIII